MSQFLAVSILIIIIWCLFALFTKGSQSTEIKPGDQFSERGATLVKGFVRIAFFVIVAVAVVKETYY